MTNLLLTRKISYFSLGLLDKYLLRRQPGIFILCYHGLSDNKWRFNIPIEKFKIQVNYLYKHYHPLALSDLSEYLSRAKNISKPSFILTFDDGFRNILSAKDFLVRLKIKPTVFLTSSPFKVDRIELGTHQELLNTQDVLSLIKNGWEIGCHSATHPDFSKLSPTDQQQEIKISKHKLESQMGTKISYFAYPKGNYNYDILSSVKDAGYSMGLTMDDNPITHKSNPLLLPRIGIDKTHSFTEFIYTFSPSVVSFRGLLKRFNLGKTV